MSYRLRANPEKRFSEEDNQLIEEFYQCLLSEFVNEPGPLNESMEKSIALYLHHLGLRRASKEDLRRWMKLNVLDLDENFKDENSYISSDDDGAISEDEYKKLLCNITIHSLVWVGMINLDSKSRLSVTKEGDRYLREHGMK